MRSLRCPIICPRSSLHHWKITFTAGGLNHFSILLDVRYKDSGADAYPDVRAKAPAYFAASLPCSNGSPIKKIRPFRWNIKAAAGQNENFQSDPRHIRVPAHHN
jgi:hypothetical protein